MFKPVKNSYPVQLISFLSMVILLWCCTNNKSNEQETGLDDSVTSVDRDSAAAHVVQVPAPGFPLDSLLAFDSESDLKKTFGEKLRRVKGYYPEGMGEYSITLLFAGTTNQVGFVWKDDSVTHSGLEYLTVSTPQSRWRTKSGIGIGTTLKELELLNQKPFSFYGFGWDYSGMTSWEEGSLSEQHVSVTLGTPPNSSGPYTDSIQGDRNFQSSSQIAQRVNPTVWEIVLRRSEPEYD